MSLKSEIQIKPLHPKCHDGMGLNSSAAFSLQFLFIHIKTDNTFAFVIEIKLFVVYNDFAMFE